MRKHYRADLQTIGLLFIHSIQIHMFHTNSLFAYEYFIHGEVCKRFVVPRNNSGAIPHHAMW